MMGNVFNTGVKFLCLRARLCIELTRGDYSLSRFSLYSTAINLDVVRLLYNFPEIYILYEAQSGITYFNSQVNMKFYVLNFGWLCN
jgi:hypothetical protein